MFILSKKYVTWQNYLIDLYNMNPLMQDSDMNPLSYLAFLLCKDFLGRPNGFFFVYYSCTPF
jgi:hypothetical protein